MKLSALFFPLVTVISAGWCADTDRTETNPSTIQQEQLIRHPLLGDDQILYPRHEIDTFEAFGGRNEDGSWLLGTRSTMRRLSHFAHKGDIEATLYLAHAFNQTCLPGQTVCPLAAQLYETAFTALEKIAEQENHPDFAKANYLLGKEYYSPAYMQHHRKPITNRIETALKYLQTTTLPAAVQLQNLIKLQEENQKSCTKPVIDDFLNKDELKSFPWIFLRILQSYGLSIEKDICLLSKAIEISPHAAIYMALADKYKLLFNQTHDKQYHDLSLTSLQQAGKLGCPIAYIEITKAFAPYEVRGHFFDFKKLKTEEIAKCEEYLQEATKLGLPEGAYNLARLKHEICSQTDFQKTSSEEDLIISTIEELYKQSAQLGFWGAYSIFEEILDSEDEFFSNYPPLKQEKENLFKIASTRL